MPAILAGRERLHNTIAQLLGISPAARRLRRTERMTLSKGGSTAICELMVKEDEQLARSKIRIVQNWFDELKELVPTEN